MMVQAKNNTFGWVIIEWGYLICPGESRHVFLKKAKESDSKALVSMNSAKKGAR